MSRVSTMRARRRGDGADARRALLAALAMACASAACASTAANATAGVSNATLNSGGDPGDPLRPLARDPSLPRELRARVRSASRELADAGLAPLAATALETYGGATEVRRRDPTRPTPAIHEHASNPPLTPHSPPLRTRRRRATSPPCAPR